MASPANTPQTSNECQRCGTTFTSVQELLEHEKNKPSAAAAEDAKKDQQPTADMVVEDRFEATDN